MSECSSVLLWLLQRSIPPPSVEICQASDQDPSQHTNDFTLQSVRRALSTSVFGNKDVDDIEREFLDALQWEFVVTQTDIIAHYSAIGGTYHSLRKRPSNTSLSPSFHSSLTTTTTTSTVPSIIYTWDTSIAMQNSTTTYGLSTRHLNSARSRWLPSPSSRRITFNIRFPRLPSLALEKKT